MMGSKKIYFIVFVTAVLLVITDLIFGNEASGSYIIPIIFWGGIAQGLFALLSAIELSEGKWAGSIKDYIKNYQPVLLIFPFMFLIFSRHIDIYSWSKHPEGWLSPGIFITRNFFALLLPFIFSFILVKAISRNSRKKKLFAGLYILSFVISQSFLAFDVVMTIEFPWINTLFGGYFFVEALYAGITFASVIAALLYIRNREKFSETLKDTAKMVMGFALLWVGLFFSQYLVIWYGNLPEEVSFIEKRLQIDSLKYLGIYILLSLFVIPFIAYISKKAKTSTPIVFVISFFVLSGYYLEKVLLLLPTVRIDISTLITGSLLCGIPFLFVLRNQLKKELE